MRLYPIFNEDTGQPTSIDLVIRGERNTHSLFIEAKLVEREFGGCSVFQGGDCDGRNPAHELGHCYLHHIGRRYWELLEKHGFLSGPVGASPICPLTLYYQFFRELLFAIESGGDFVLLYDERNPSFYMPESAGVRGLMPFLRTFVPEGLQARVHAISIQQIVDFTGNRIFCILCQKLTWQVKDDQISYSQTEFGGISEFYWPKRGGIL